VKDNIKHTKIFVYGSLKKGFTNDYVLETLKAQYICTAKTNNKALMYDSGDGWPYVQFTKDDKGNYQGYHIDGEIHSIPSSSIDMLDRFEGVPDLYKKTHQIVTCPKGNEHYCLMYIVTEQKSYNEVKDKLIENWKEEHNDIC